MPNRSFTTGCFSKMFFLGAIPGLMLMLIIYSTVMVQSGHQSFNSSHDAQALLHRYQSMDTSQQPYLSMIHAITPTYARLTQKADLVRLVQTLRLVPRLHWIVVEDAVNRTVLVTRLLERSHVNVTHLNARTPDNERGSSFPRGVLQRNTALAWLRNQTTSVDGVVYFMDDDNAYHVDIFEEMRSTRNVSVWPVGLITPWFEAPVVEDGKVTKWNTVFKRKFSTDMAGFAVNVRLLLKKPGIEFRMKPGHLETDLLSQLELELSDLEPKADNCTKVLVWHTKARTYDVNKTDLARKFGSGYVGTEV